MINSSSFADSKQHFKVLDALRGIAAIMVVVFHAFEIFYMFEHEKLIINHGYLAVDFFFMLSGYVMAHAYDDRWHTLTYKDFFKRRIIRLHPLIILSTIIGAICFYYGAGTIGPKIASTPLWQLALVAMAGCLLIPLPVKTDIRGWEEMYPLNGPAWSLFFEYIANFLHATILRKFAKWQLAMLCFFSALLFIDLAIAKGDVTGGWSFNMEQLGIGFTRLLFPYMAGMLLKRVVTQTQVLKQSWASLLSFMLSAVLLVLMLSLPRFATTQQHLYNGLYESFAVIIVFPIIIILGAVGNNVPPVINKLCTFLGDISYPIYIIHYPFIYVFYAWLQQYNIPLQGAFFAIFMFTITMVALAYLSLKLYDEPVRKWLAKKYMKNG
jgi:peptidoglycan/LPS O-acetylase OafA/YrhL